MIGSISAPRTKNLSWKGLRFIMKRSKPSKAYLKRQAEVEAKWQKKPSRGDDLIADLEYLVGIRKELAL